MKLLFVIHQFFPECHSGTEQYCLAVSREARRRGDEVVVFSLDPHVWRDDPPLHYQDDRDYDGFHVPRLRPWRGLSPNEVLFDYDNPIVARRFAQVLRDVRPDAVHFFHLRRLGADLIRVAHDAGVRTVVNLMDFWFLCPRFTLLRTDGSLCEGPPDGGLGCIRCEHPELHGAWDDPSVGGAARTFAAGLRQPLRGATTSARFAALLRRKDALLERLALADAVIAPSRFLAAMFERNGFRSDRMVVVPYGLEPERVRRMVVTRPRTPLRVGFAGVLSPRKGADVLVRAVRNVRGAIRLTVHGRLEESMFADYIASVRDLAAGDPRIEFPGAFGSDELDRVLAALDLLVVPSLWYENTPFTILEAFEAGVAVAASALGGMTEVVVPGTNGFCFPPGDVDALAALLQSLVDDPERFAGLDPQPVGSVASNYDVFSRLYQGRELSAAPAT